METTGATPSAHTPDPAVTFRPVREDDEEFVWCLRRDTMRELIEQTIGWRDASQRLWVRDIMQCGRIVVMDGDDIGVLATKDLRDFGIAEWNLSFIAVVPRMQGRGLGAAVLRALQREAEHAQCDISLRVAFINRARHLYERLGFVEFRGDGHMASMRWKCPSRGGRALPE